MIRCSSNFRRWLCLQSRLSPSRMVRPYGGRPWSCQTPPPLTGHKFFRPQGRLFLPGDSRTEGPHTEWGRYRARYTDQAWLRQATAATFLRQGLSATLGARPPTLLMQTRRPKHSSTIEEFVPLDQRPKTFPAGRRCRSCHSVLSIYNSQDRCWPCFPQGRRMVRMSSRDHEAEALDFAELMQEDAA